MQTHSYRRHRFTVAIHAAIIGIGWFVVGLPLGVLAAAHDHRTAAMIRAMPDWSLAPIALVVLVIAFPLLWPAWLALGWLEMGLIAESSMRTRALRRVVVGQAIGWLVLAAATLPSVVWSFRASSSPLLRWVWLGPVTVAALHYAVARAIPRTAT